MKPKLKELKYEDFVKLVEIIVKLSNSREPFLITTQLEYFITGLNMQERIMLNMLVSKYLEHKTIDKDEFEEFIRTSRNTEIEIDEEGKTPPEKINFTEMKLKTIVFLYSEKIRKKTHSREDKQIIDAWGLEVFKNVQLTKDYKEQEEFLINKYRSMLVDRLVFDEYSKKIEQIFGTIDPWRYIINYCKAKRIKETFETFLSVTYTIIDCIYSDKNILECQEYIKKFEKIILDNKLW